MMSTNVSAQFDYSWDSVMVKNVQVWYPGPPDTGKIKAELWWHHPEIPYSGPCGGLDVYLKWGDTREITCDSISWELTSMLDSAGHYFGVDNALGQITCYVWKNSSYAFIFQPGHYHIADLYFTTHSPGRFTTDSVSAPVFNNPPVPLYWLGRQFATANVIAAPGDFNGDGVVNISDCVYGISFVFGPFDDPVPCGDANGSCFVNVSDVVYMINYLFLGGPEPEAGCAFWR